MPWKSGTTEKKEVVKVEREKDRLSEVRSIFERKKPSLQENIYISYKHVSKGIIAN